MESLLENLEFSLKVSSEPNTTSAPHPRFSQHKLKRSGSSQEERRRKFLEAQKQKRYDLVKHARCLAEGHWETDEEEDGAEGKKETDEKQEDEEMDCSQPRRPERSYKNQLMLSEWLVDVPEDFESEWLLMPCPQGKRCLLIASKGFAKVYSRTGYLITSFTTAIPGGNLATVSAYSLLDCVYCERSKTYYILDIMCWRNHPVFDSETEFRFYWLHSKVSEIPELQNPSRPNKPKFIPLPYFLCTAESIQNALDNISFEEKLDGLLFYHKRLHYSPGVTPLVGWLKAYMVPEILNIPVSDKHMSQKPVTYTSLQEKLEAQKHQSPKEKSKKKVKGSSEGQMEVV